MLQIIFSLCLSFRSGADVHSVSLKIFQLTAESFRSFTSQAGAGKNSHKAVSECSDNTADVKIFQNCIFCMMVSLDLCLLKGLAFDTEVSGLATQKSVRLPSFALMASRQSDKGKIKPMKPVRLRISILRQKCKKMSFVVVCTHKRSACFASLCKNPTVQSAALTR